MIARIAKGVARTLLHRLSDNQKYFALRELADALGISNVVANGSIGPIEGNLNDWTIFRRYVESHKAWEARTASVCAEFFKPHGKGTFIDVGANIGMIFIPVLRDSPCFGIAVDASPVNFPCLAANCARNLDPSRYRLHHVAVGDKAGKVRFATNGANFGNHRVVQSGGVEVDMIRFDDLYDVNTLAKPILVKLDIQGSEPMFMTGAARLMDECDALLLEYSPFNGADPDFDLELSNRFSRMSRYDIAPESGSLSVNLSTLNHVKTSIASRPWKTEIEGHENILFWK